MSIETIADHSTTAAKVTVIAPDRGRSFTAFGSNAQFKLEGERRLFAARIAPHVPERREHAAPSLGTHNASGFDEFYRGAAEIFAAGGAPDVHKLGALAAKHGYEFLRD